MGRVSIPLKQLETEWRAIERHLLDYLDEVRKGIREKPTCRCGHQKYWPIKTSLIYLFREYLKEKNAAFVPALATLMKEVSKQGRLFDIVRINRNESSSKQVFFYLRKDVCQRLVKELNDDIKNDKLHVIAERYISFYQIVKWLSVRIKKIDSAFEFYNQRQIFNMCRRFIMGGQADISFYHDRKMEGVTFTSKMLPLPIRIQRDIRRLQNENKL